MKFAILTTIALLYCTSCSLTPSQGDDVSDLSKSPEVSFDTDVLDSDRIVQNLVFSIIQIESLHPFKTTLQMKAPRGELAKLVKMRFEDAGYGIQYVESDQGVNYVRHSAQSSVSEEGDTTTYRITVGDISVERDYMLSGKYTVPESELRVTGAYEQDIHLNDDVFGEEFSKTQYTDVHFDESDVPVIITVADRDISFDKKPVAVDGEVAAAEAPKTGNTFARAVMQNVRTIMGSNFSEIFAGYEDVQRDVLIFPNDSLRLGTENKTLIQQYADGLNTDTDVLSVIGCSHGRSKVKNGNQLLAIGRANRVKEALIFAGLAHRLIFEEGCWDKEHYGPMPARGVVLTHKRKI